MVASLHNGLFKILTPNLGGPITNRQKEFLLEGVSLQGVDGTVMLSTLLSESGLDFNVLSLTDLKNISLLSSDQVFDRGMV